MPKKYKGSLYISWEILTIIYFFHLPHKIFGFTAGESEYESRSWQAAHFSFDPWELSMYMLFASWERIEYNIENALLSS